HRTAFSENFVTPLLSEAKRLGLGAEDVIALIEERSRELPLTTALDPTAAKGRPMNSVVELRHLTKTYKTTTALNDVSLSIEQDSIYGLLGRNGAGKTTLMSILTAQNFATSGEVEVFGENPYENARVLSRMCFVRESQKYPEDSNAKHALANARLFFPHWDQALAEELIDEFRLPLKTTIKKL